MKESYVVAAAVGALLVPIANAGKTVQWDIQKDNHRKATFGKRSTSAYSEVIKNDVARGGYFATCSIGTPSQNMTMQLDTGSSDIWIPWSSAPLCERYDCSLGTCSFALNFP